jgi:hypothetical protein
VHVLKTLLATTALLLAITSANAEASAPEAAIADLEAVTKTATLMAWMTMCPDEAKARADRMEKYLVSIGVVQRRHGKEKLKNATLDLTRKIRKEISRRKFCNRITASLDEAEAKQGAQKPP